MGEMNDYCRSSNINQYENYSVIGNTINTKIESMEQNDIIDLNGKNALKAVIYSEILGKPRCKRKRWK